MNPELVVIGLGPAGCLFLASLPPEKLGSQILAIESGCIGGDLARLYGNVVANLTRTEMESAFRKIPQWSSISEFKYFSNYQDTQCPLLSDVCKQLRELMTPILAKITVKFGSVGKLEKVEQGWRIHTKTESIQTRKVILCTGANPVQMDLPKSVIPLEIALHKQNLANFISPDNSIVVFGTAHSGTLILRNLREIGCKKVSAIYKCDKPFRWAREGDTEGIKQDSAAIADEIVAGVWGALTPTLISLSDTGTMIRRVLEADYVVYAIGFESRHPTIDGCALSVNSETGNLAPGLWGFGIGFPSFYTTPNGKKAHDVGFGPFADHILQCLSAILAA